MEEKIKYLESIGYTEVDFLGYELIIKRWHNDKMFGKIVKIYTHYIVIASLEDLKLTHELMMTNVEREYKKWQEVMTNEKSTPKKQFIYYGRPTSKR